MALEDELDDTGQFDTIAGNSGSTRQPGPTPGTGNGNANPSPAASKSGPWMHAWHDPLAGLRTHNSCVRFADLYGDGDYRLVVADNSRLLKVYRGTGVAEVLPLLEQPVALCCFYAAAQLPPLTASIAVAAGPSVYIYRNMRPYFKFMLPPRAANPAEDAAWAILRTIGGHGGKSRDDADADAVWDALSAARDRGVPLSTRAQDFLALSDPEDRRRSFAALASAPPPSLARSSMTCMETICRSGNGGGGDGGAGGGSSGGDRGDEAVLSSLVLGTEDGEVILLDPPSTIRATVRLPAVPAFLAPSGALDAEWRIVVACRGGRLFTVKSGESRGSAVVTGTVIDLGAAPCALARLQKCIYAATADDRLHSILLKGRRNFALQMPAAITALEPLVTRTSARLLVALASGEVRLYMEKALVHSLMPVGHGGGGGLSGNLGGNLTSGNFSGAGFGAGTGIGANSGNGTSGNSGGAGGRDAVAALRFGRYAREENTMAVVTRGGAVVIKMLSRRSSLEPSGGSAPGPPPEQDIPLAIPKRTKLHVEQTERERAHGPAMHRAFQRDLCLLRLQAARGYVKLISAGEMAGTGTAGAPSVRLTAECRGLGPNFRLRLGIQNAGARSLLNVSVAFVYPRRLYRMECSQFLIPLLLPGLLVHRSANVTSVDEAGAAGPVRVIILASDPTARGGGGSGGPLASAVINMPPSELLDV